MFRSADQQCYNESVYVLSGGLDVDLGQGIYDLSDGLDVDRHKSDWRPYRRACCWSVLDFANSLRPREMKDEKRSPQTSTALDNKDLALE